MTEFMLSEGKHPALTPSAAVDAIAARSFAVFAAQDKPS
jgi:hypothetical protein